LAEQILHTLGKRLDVPHVAARMEATMSLSSSTRRGAFAALLSAGMLCGACTSPGEFTKTEKGAVLGGVLGGVAGGVISNSVRGTLIGAVLGGVGGAIIGKVMDKRADNLASSLTGANVERVGEGIAVAFDDDAFEAGSARLKAQGERDLGKVAAQLARDEDIEAVLVGHADGDAALAKRRASTARAFLVDHGADADRVKVRSDASSGDSPLEIAIVATDEAKAKAKRDAQRS
jgi:outer membrane protein OmpA-like peptidoglycan-associated protein